MDGREVISGRRVFVFGGRGFVLGEEVRFRGGGSFWRKDILRFWRFAEAGG
jgi:hypothetical protein